MGATFSKCAGASDKRKAETLTTKSRLDSGVEQKSNSFDRNPANYNFGNPHNLSECCKSSKELYRGQSGTTYMCVLRQNGASVHCSCSLALGSQRIFEVNISSFTCIYMDSLLFLTHA